MCRETFLIYLLLKPLPMKPIITLLFVVICATSFAQNDPVIRNAEFLSFEEFKSNTPSGNFLTAIMFI